MTKIVSSARWRSYERRKNKNVIFSFIDNDNSKYTLRVIRNKLIQKHLKHIWWHTSETKANVHMGFVKEYFKTYERNFTAKSNICYISFDITVMNTFYKYLKNKLQQAIWR